MLKGIHPALSPQLLKVLCEMGHGEEILLADAHFPAHTYGNKIVRADGVVISTLLKGIMPLFQLDQYSDAPLVMMQFDVGETFDPQVEEKYTAAISQAVTNMPEIQRIERKAFYERAEKCYSIVLTGETAKYGNIILKKGVTEG